MVILRQSGVLFARLTLALVVCLVAGLLIAGMAPDPASSGVAPYRIYNIGNEQPVELLRYIEILENCLGKKAIKNLLPLQPGDVPDTYADVDALIEDVDYKPSTPVEVGIETFVKWYRDYYKI